MKSMLAEIRNLKTSAKESRQQIFAKSVNQSTAVLMKAKIIQNFDRKTQNSKKPGVFYSPSQGNLIMGAY